MVGDMAAAFTDTGSSAAAEIRLSDKVQTRTELLVCEQGSDARDLRGMEEGGGGPATISRCSNRHLFAKRTVDSGEIAQLTERQSRGRDIRKACYAAREEKP